MTGGGVGFAGFAVWGLGMQPHDPDFMARAPETVVNENHERLAEAESAKLKLEAALARFDTLD